MGRTGELLKNAWMGALSNKLKTATSVAWKNSTKGKLQKLKSPKLRENDTVCCHLFIPFWIGSDYVFEWNTQEPTKNFNLIISTPSACYSSLTNLQGRRSLAPKFSKQKIQKLFVKNYLRALNISYLKKNMGRKKLKLNEFLCQSSYNFFMTDLVMYKKYILNFIIKRLTWKSNFRFQTKYKAKFEEI